MYLCYNTPAASDYASWQKKSIPLGNGSIGARVFGGIQCEIIQFNEKTLFSGDVNRTGSYQNFGEMFLSFNSPVPCSENTYLRDLDLETGSAMVACRKGLDGHTRHYFISAADNVFVGKIESTGDTLLDFTLSLQSEQNGEIIYDGAYAYLSGTVNANNGVGRENGEDKNNLRYFCCVKVLADDGKITSSENGICVSDTFTARIVMSCATEFFSEDDLDKCRENVEKASAMTFPQLFKRHLDDYKKINSRLRLSIGQSDVNMTADALLRSYSKGKNRQSLEALMFEMGKYVLYSSSRRLSLPMTESGIWNSRNVPEEREILINMKKAKNAAEIAKTLNMDEAVASFSAFSLSHGEEKRYNPFGKSTECTEEVRRKVSVFSRLTGSKSAHAGELIEKAEKAAKCGKEKDAARFLSDAVLRAYDNLLFSDIFDNISYSDCVRKMLIDLTEDNVISFLPSLPQGWGSGSFGAVKLENGFEISFEWSNRRLKGGKITALNDGVCCLNAFGRFIGISDNDGNDVDEKFENGTISFTAEKGKAYIMY